MMRQAERAADSRSYEEGRGDRPCAEPMGKASLKYNSGNTYKLIVAGLYALIDSW